MKRIALIAGGLLVIMALAGVLRPEGANAVDEPATRPDTVSVSGTGAVRAVPDRASISAGVETRGSTAEEALSLNGKAMDAVLAALRAAGGKDVTTSSVSLSPRQTPEGQPDGFTTSNMATAEFPLALAGKAIDAAVGAGANTIYGPSFSFSNAEDLYLQALDRAVANAKTHAERLAAATGRTLGRVLVIGEGSTGPVPMYAKSDSISDGTPIVSGEQETSASVTITYELT